MPQSDPTQAPPSPSAPAAAPTESRPAWADDLVKAVGETVGQWSQQVVKAVAQGAPAPRAPQPAAPSPAAPEPDALESIASRGWSSVDERVERRAKEIAERTLKDTLGPWFQQELPERAQGNESAARAAIDKEFGDGAFDEIFKPELDTLFGDRVVDRAAAPQYRQAVDSLKGKHFNSLADRRAEVARTRAEAAEKEKQVNAPYLPGPGFRYVPDNELDEGSKAQLAKMREKRVGNLPTEEDAAKLRDLMLECGPDGVSLDAFNELFPAKPAQAGA